MVPDVLNHWPKNKRADGNQMHSEWGKLPTDRLPGSIAE